MDELDSLLAQKKQIWQPTAFDHFKRDILRWVLGDRSLAKFQYLWKIEGRWQYYFYVTNGWKVYPQFISDGDQIVSQTYMTRVEREIPLYLIT